MLRQALMFKGIFLSTKQFKEVLEIVTDDLKAHGKHLKIEGIIDIAVIASRVLKRCV